jgi:hypothetical protein
MGIESSPENLATPQDVWEFEIEDFLVLARPDVHGLYLLNSSARFIWQLVKAGLPSAEVVRELASAYHIDPDVAARHVRQTLDGWRSGLRSVQPEATVQPESAASADVRVEPPAFQKKAARFSHNYLIEGKSVQIILETAELAEEIIPRFESIPSAPSAPDFVFRVVEDPDGFRIFCGDRCIAREEGLGAIRAVLLQEIVRTCRGLDCLAIFHAGACGSGSRCVVFPGNTQCGKTTLSAVLMQKGLTFYSDDSVLLERDTLAVPAMPFSLMVREGSWGILSPRFPNLESAPILSRFGQRVRFLPPLGTQQDSRSGLVSAIVFVRFERDAANEISSLDTLQTLLRLQESGFWVAHDRQSIRRFLEWLQSTPSYSLSYSDVDRAASIVRELLAGSVIE